MKKLLLVLFAVAVFTIASRALIVGAQEGGQINALADIENSNFMAEFKQEIAESNLIDEQMLRDLNALVQQLNEDFISAVANEANVAVEPAQ